MSFSTLSQNLEQLLHPQQHSTAAYKHEHQMQQHVCTVFWQSHDIVSSAACVRTDVNITLQYHSLTSLFKSMVLLASDEVSNPTASQLEQQGTRNIGAQAHF